MRAWRCSEMRHAVTDLIMPWLVEIQAPLPSADDEDLVEQVLTHPVRPIDQQSPRRVVLLLIPDQPRACRLGSEDLGYGYDEAVFVSVGGLRLHVGIGEHACQPDPHRVLQLRGRVVGQALVDQQGRGRLGARILAPDVCERGSVRVSADTVCEAAAVDAAYAPLLLTGTLVPQEAEPSDHQQRSKHREADPEEAAEVLQPGAEDEEQPDADRAERRRCRGWHRDLAREDVEIPPIRQRRTWQRMGSAGHGGVRGLAPRRMRISGPVPFELLTHHGSILPDSPHAVETEDQHGYERERRRRHAHEYPAPYRSHAPCQTRSIQQTKHLGRVRRSRFLIRDSVISCSRFQPFPGGPLGARSSLCSVFERSTPIRATAIFAPARTTPLPD
ncbi:hypothetical protein MSMEI_1553 [Mycolicibacterium smegmatis MC2 155]|uniref:Uncharacterized protein n=1 Tax=Mycolicibacterium smegmatis (strain ATCC 700084 / mc(2)155) TaxID=246196 RepID=I7G4C7_MYCS2|nr:hypothetical protein MSMEI_1553 [Mycolicibacterium smegmatis MC2 155]